jgi:hypothetical protein
MTESFMFIIMHDFKSVKLIFSCYLVWYLERYMTLKIRVTYVSPLAAMNSCISQRTLLSVYSIHTNLFNQ